jgi:hypothetical protein
MPKKCGKPRKLPLPPLPLPPLLRLPAWRRVRKVVLLRVRLQAPLLPPVRQLPALLLPQALLRPPRRSEAAGGR